MKQAAVMCVQQWEVSEGETKGVIQTWVGRQQQRWRGRGVGARNGGPALGDKRCRYCGRRWCQAATQARGLAHRGQE